MKDDENEINTSQVSRKPFLKTKIGVGLVTVFFPPIGLYLIYKNIKSKRVIWFSVATTWLVILTIGGVGAIINPNPIEKPSENESEPRETVPEASCVSSFLCEKLLGYGDKNVLRILREIGVEEINSVSEVSYGDTSKIAIRVVDNDEANWKIRDLVIEYEDGVITKIRGSRHKELIYYSKDSGEQTFKYPALEEANRIDEEYEKVIDNAVKEEDIQINLMTLTQQKIKENMTDPKSAKFSGWKFSIDENDLGIRIVSGIVSGKNIFNAKTSANFVARYRDLGNDRWGLIYLVVDDQVIVNNQ